MPLGLRRRAHPADQVGSAALVATGLVEKAGVAAAGMTNFVGYIAWSDWIVAVGAAILRRPARRDAIDDAVVRDEAALVPALAGSPLPWAIGGGPS